MGIAVPPPNSFIVWPPPPARNGALDESAPTLTMEGGYAVKPSGPRGRCHHRGPSQERTYVSATLPPPRRGRAGPRPDPARTRRPRRGHHYEGRVHAPRREDHQGEGRNR